MPAIASENRIPNKPFRDFIEEHQIPLCKVAAWMDFEVTRTRNGKVQTFPDERRIARMLGVKKGTSRGHNNVQYCRRQEYISYETAVRLCDVLGIDYWEVGV